MNTGMADTILRLMPTGRLDPVHIIALSEGTADTTHWDPDLRTISEWRVQHPARPDQAISTVVKC